MIMFCLCIVEKRSIAPVQATTDAHIYFVFKYLSFKVHIHRSDRVDIINQLTETEKHKAHMQLHKNQLIEQNKHKAPMHLHDHTTRLIILNTAI
jgi:hypothetical protein